MQSASAHDPATVNGIGIGVVPKRRRSVEARERLYDVALEEFSTAGVDAARVERIVERVGTSWGTFFRYFPRKEDVLLLAGARHFREQVRPVVDAGLEDPSQPRREIARAAFAALVTSTRSPRVHAAMLSEIVRFPLRFAATLGDGELPFIALVSTLMSDAQERAEVRSDIPAPICATVLSAGVVFSAAQVLRAAADGQVPETRVRDVAELAFEAAWSGLAC